MTWRWDTPGRLRTDLMTQTDPSLPKEVRSSLGVYATFPLTTMFPTMQRRNLIAIVWLQARADDLRTKLTNEFVFCKLSDVVERSVLRCFREVV